MSVEGVDYSLARPSPVSLAAAGKRFACRYLSNVGNPKNLTRPEAQELTAAGVAIVSNWEWRASDAKLGYDFGADYARRAHAMAVACGMPATRPIYFSVDFDATTAELEGPVDAYLRGVASVIGLARTGVYGGYRTIEWAARTGRARWLWQTYAWSAGRWHPAAHIRQYLNGQTVAGTPDIDLDRGMTADYGQWTVGSAPMEEEDMTPDQAAQLARVDHRVTTLLYNTPTNVWGESGEENQLYKVLKLIAEHVDVDPAELEAIEEAARAGAEAGALAAADELVARILAGIQQGADLTPAQMEQVEQAVRNAFAGGLAPDRAAPAA